MLLLFFTKSMHGRLLASHWWESVKSCLQGRDQPFFFFWLDRPLRALVGTRAPLRSMKEGRSNTLVLVVERLSLPSSGQRSQGS